jgi:hypothetical protein
LKVNDVLFTRSTGHSAKRFLGKHGIILVLSALIAHGHYQVVEILDLLFKKLKSLLSILLISEFLG